MTSTTSLIPAAQPCENALLKTDVLGRIKRTREQRERILDEYERSGLSGPKFATLCGVKYHTFATWLQSRKRQRNEYPRRKPQRKAGRPVQWIEAQLESGGPQSRGTGLLIHLPGGARAHISSQQQVHLAAALVRALEKSC